MSTEKNKINLSKNLEDLSEIADWFEQQDEIDVEEGLKKVKKAAGLIKESKGRLSEIENEFEEIKKDIEDEIDDEEEIDEEEENNDEEEVPVQNDGIENIPF